MIRGRAIRTAVIGAAALILTACSSVPPPPPPAPAPPPPLAPNQTIEERTLLTMAADLDFRSGDYKLTRAGEKELAGVIPQIQAMPDAKIVVYGYTDDRPIGAALKKKGIEDNLDLSNKRASEVVRFLISKGIDANIISAKGRGDTHPVAPNDTPRNRAKNRRIEVVVNQPTSTTGH
jgi:flagellar motor protein MotB